MTIEQTPLEWTALWQAMDANPEQWIPTTEKMYGYMLEVLPPTAYWNGAFLVGEPRTFDRNTGEDIFACFAKCGEDYKAKHLTTRQFKNDEVQA